MMFGQTQASDKPVYRKTFAAARDPGRQDRHTTNPVLDIRSLVVQVPGKPFLRGIDLQLWPGIIHGIAGVRDSGTETLELAIAGMIPADSGEIEVLGKRISEKNPKSFRHAGGAWVPADRTGVALALRLTMQDNMVVHALGRATRNTFRIMSKTNLRGIANRILSDARVVGDPRQLASGFSGGTLQRAVLARELAENAPFLLLSEPGWGLDLENKAILHREIAASAERGTSILLISTDLDELVSLSDTISVMRDGIIVATFHPASGMPALREAIGAAMTGSEACPDVG
jgi:simple sugar transport system ATP-binding protein